MGIFSQIHRNAVALISLTIAIASLSYNTWRNEQTEQNRNVRHAGFEMLMKLGELQRVIFFNVYDNDEVAGNPRHGWAFVLDIRDLSRLMPPPMPDSADALFTAWETHWEPLTAKDRDSERAVTDSIDRARHDVIAVLTSLD